MAYTQLWNSQTIKSLTFLDRHSFRNIAELGVFEGLTSNYFCDNLLTHDGTLTCIDPLDSNYQLDNDNELFQGQYERFVENTERNKDKIWHIRKKTQEVLGVLRSDSYDLVFVDADHTYPSVYHDGTEAFRMAKDFGYVLFDDFEWGNAKPVKAAVELILQEHPNHRLLLKGDQVLIQKLPEGSPTENRCDWYQEKSVEKLFSWDKIYMSFCNLDSRPDRQEKMLAELVRVGVPMVKTRSFPWQELYENFSDEEKEKVDVMYKRTPGAIGCYYSQMEVMREALRQGKHAIVLEDDLVFCNDFPSRLHIIYKFLNQHEWDVFWFGGTYHNEPHWHKSVEGKHTHPELQQCNCTLNRDWEETLNPNIVKTFGAFSTHAYMVNKDRLEHILNVLEHRMSISIGIDWSFILEQPNLNCFAFNPGCIKQYDSMSDISKGMANQSGFAKLGKHFWAASMNDK